MPDKIPFEEWLSYVYRMLEDEWGPDFKELAHADEWEYWRALYDEGLSATEAFMFHDETQE